MPRKGNRSIQIGRHKVKGGFKRPKKLMKLPRLKQSVKQDSQIFPPKSHDPKQLLRGWSQEERASPVELTASCAEFQGWTFCDVLPMLNRDGLFGDAAAFKSPTFLWVSPHPCHYSNSKYIGSPSKLFPLSLVSYLGVKNIYLFLSP